MINNETFIRVNGKVVGEVILDRFFKNIKGSKHMLRVPPAIAFDTQSLRDAVSAGAKEARVTDTETGVEYVADILDIYSKGFRLNRGYGEQIALELNQWAAIPPAGSKQ